MSYSGNPSLSADVKQRILSTFDQTLELARDGNRQEALLGCDFVLRMDPQFQPAQLLQERLRSSSGPVRVEDLQGKPDAGAMSATLATPEDPFGDLDSLDLDLPPALPDSAGYLRDELQTLLDQRRFQDLMALAEREQNTIALQPELRRIVGNAQELMEAEPYVLKFLTSARQAAQLGQHEEVARLLEKTRALDPDHPGIAALERSRGASVPPPAVLEIPSPLQVESIPLSLDFGGGDSESDRRIQELLREGQTAFDAGDPQGAIDAWSRIFLIDIDHQEASRRIEAARKLKAESERQVEEIFHDGLSRLEAGDLEAARGAFQRVLELQPAYFAAREYLQQLEAGNVPTVKATGVREPTAAEPMLSPIPSDLDVAGQELKEEILVPPEPGEQPAPTGERKPAKRTAASRDPGRARRLFALVGGAVLVLAAVGAWFVYQNRERLFPNSQSEEAPAALSQDPIARAQGLHAAGKTAIALNQLRRIPPSDPQYQRAQKLITEWRGPATSPTPALPAAPTPAQLAAAAASQEAATRRQALLAATKRELEPLSKQIEFFRQHEWEYILRDLWIMHDNNPSDRDVTQLLVDSNYNLAVRDLQRNDTTKALSWLNDAVKLAPEDAVLRRHYLFAQTYQERPKDLLYKIYVKYLPFR